MQIFVRAGQLHLLDVDASLTVAGVKALVAAREGVALECARASLDGRSLEDNATLLSAGVNSEATLQILGRLLGGGKKRKKKIFTKPKKLKHKHKNVKLRVLSCYKVDDSGKVHRILKQCPTCGPGTFMANHFDRVYCGKCSLTFLLKNNEAGEA